MIIIATLMIQDNVQVDVQPLLLVSMHFGCVVTALRVHNEFSPSVGSKIDNHQH